MLQGKAQVNIKDKILDEVGNYSALMIVWAI